MRSSTSATGHRTVLATLLALAFALRLLSPDGFMPSFEHGAVTIVSCPDAWPMGPMAAHHHGKIAPQPCPYAGAAAAGALPTPGPALVQPAAVSASLKADLLVERLEPARSRARPPATGPPLLPA